MTTTLTNFRAEMFRLLPRIKAGEQLKITHKHEDYILIKAETFKKQLLADKLSRLPKLNITQEEIKSFKNSGRY